MPEPIVRARLADLAGGDPEDTIVPLLERAIEYLCLPRRSLPGCPPAVGTQVCSSGKGKEVASFRAAIIAAVAAKANSKKARDDAAVEAETGTTTQGRSVAATPSSSSPRQRSASPTAASSASGGRKLKGVAALAREKAAARAADALLQWDSDSLASLLGVHQAMSASLLRLERSMRQVVDPAPKESQRSSRLEATAEFDLDGDDKGDRHHRPQSAQSLELFKRAETSLTVALAAAKAGVRPETPSPTPDEQMSGEGNKSSTAGGELPSPSRRPSSSHTPTSVAQAAGDGGGRPTAFGESCIPITVRGIDEDHGCIPITMRGIGADQKELQEPPRRRSRGTATSGRRGSVLAAGADPEAMAMLYGMRCTAKEGLGLIEDAFHDCAQALAAAPRAPKLWGKAASLALRIGSEAERKRKRTRPKAGVLSIKAYCDGWATEVRSRKSGGVCVMWNEAGIIAAKWQKESISRAFRRV